MKNECFIAFICATLVVFNTNSPFIKQKGILNIFTSKINFKISVAKCVQFISQIYYTSSKFEKFELNLEEKW